MQLHSLISIMIQKKKGRLPQAYASVLCLPYSSLCRLASEEELPSRQAGPHGTAAPAWYPSPGMAASWLTAPWLLPHLPTTLTWPPPLVLGPAASAKQGRLAHAPLDLEMLLTPAATRPRRSTTTHPTVSWVKLPSASGLALLGSAEARVALEW
jgi:hypothetical protein